ncbi:hypothetical protein [Sandaracinus amylolyticus]|uniref:hypothetical protein n=1 Tax=Sandaracinus amylolyticus TaxID=927083 RepID=UPI001F32C837|nr:hypothetical protein [Sandaracinus amylolyticus]UJR84008.1 Hypothetical protein I5071_60790 [Sandaracinus amylolyticus]
MNPDRHGVRIVIAIALAGSLHPGCSCFGGCGPVIDCTPISLGVPDFPDGSLVIDASDELLCSDYGAHCDDVVCTSGLICRREVAITAQAEQPDGTPAPPLEVLAFPGGLCTQECDPDDPSTCPGCTVCVPHVVAGRAFLAGPVRAPGLCRPRCTSSDECGEEYACDPVLGACVERCTSDSQCAYVTTDDGVLAYAPDERWICGSAGTCVVQSTIGAACTDSEDCEIGTECQISLGTCTHRCANDHQCPLDTRCAGVDGEGWCVVECLVGDDAPEDRVGSSGHGSRCDAGLACVSDGTCRRGNYNDVLEPNLGAACTIDAECWSPFGRGECFRATPSLETGVCVLSECAPDADLYPDIDVLDVVLCDPERGDACVQLTEGHARCVHTCESADACAPGHACIEPWQLAPRVCTSHCVHDVDCRGSEVCRAPDGLACITSGDCTCVPSSSTAP